MNKLVWFSSLVVTMMLMATNGSALDFRYIGAQDKPLPLLRLLEGDPSVEERVVDGFDGRMNTVVVIGVRQSAINRLLHDIEMLPDLAVPLPIHDVVAMNGRTTTRMSVDEFTGLVDQVVAFEESRLVIERLQKYVSMLKAVNRPNQSRDK